MKQEYHDETGNQAIWRLFYPLILLTFAQKAGSIFEGILVSIHSSRELTITAICGPYITIITTVSYGMGIAVNVMTARINGNREWRVAGGRIVRNIFKVVIGSSAALSLGSAVLMYQAFEACPELRVAGYLYMLPYLLGSPVILLYSMLIAGLRGFGDMKTGMWMTFLAVPVQVMLGFELYKHAGLSALGYGMLVSRLVSCFYGYSRYKRHQPVISGEGQTLPEHFFREFALLALPLSLSKVITPSANVLINTLLLDMGTEIVAVNGLGNRLSVFFYMPAMATGTAAVTLVAGLSQKEDLSKLNKRLFIWSVCPAIVMSAAAYVFTEPIWNALTSDPIVQSAGYGYWRICLLAYPLISVEMTATSILQALGHGMPTLIITAIRVWGVQLPLTYAAGRFGVGAKGAWLAYLASNVVSVAVSVIWGCRKVKIKIQEGNYECN